MLMQKSFLAVCAGTMLFAAAASAQTPPPAPSTATGPTEVTAPPATPEGGVPAFVKPETAEQRKSRLSTPEDPGLNPDPKKHFWRFGKSFHIEKFERQWAAFDEPEGFVRPWKF